MLKPAQLLQLLLLAVLLCQGHRACAAQTKLHNTTLNPAQHAAFAARVQHGSTHKMFAPESLGRRRLLGATNGSDGSFMPLHNVTLTSAQHRTFASAVHARRIRPRFSPYSSARRLLDADFTSSYVVTPLSEAMADGSPMLDSVNKRPLQLAFDVTNLSPADDDTAARARYTTVQMLPALQSFLRRSLRVRPPHHMLQYVLHHAASHATALRTSGFAPSPLMRSNTPSHPPTAGSCAPC